MRRTSLKSIVVGSVGIVALGSGIVALPMTSASAASPPPVGTLAQPPGTAGCLQGIGVPAEGCATARALDNAGPVVSSPDGKNVYVGGTNDGGSVAVFTRNFSGQLIQPGGAGGCITQKGSDGCATLATLTSITDMILVGDNLYVAESNGHVRILARDPGTGALSDSGCLQDTTSQVPDPRAPCTQVPGMPHPAGLAASPDGSALFITSTAVTGGATGSLAVVQLDGQLPPPPQPAGCYQTGVTPAAPPAQDLCTAAVGLVNPIGADVSDDGKNLYVASFGVGRGNGAAVIFNVSGTALTQPASTEACIGNLTGCKAGRALGGASDIDVSPGPDGKSVYVAQQDVDNNNSTFTGGGLVRLDRAAAGTLTQPDAGAGCIVQAGSAGEGQGCTIGRGLLGAGSVVVSPDGKSVYTAAAALNAAIPPPASQGGGSSAIAVFDRDSTGAVTQGATTRGCISKTATEGCAVARGLNSPGASIDGLAMSPTGNEVYASGALSRSLAVFERHMTDLSITTTAPGQPYIVGQTNSLTLSVQNSGPIEATNVTVTDVVTNPGAIVDATPSQGTCSSPPISCNLGTVKVAAGASVVVRFVTNAAGTATNTAAVRADQGDAAFDDNTSVTSLQAAGPGLTPVSGGGQQTKFGTAFAAPLKVALRNSAGQPIPSASVTFTAPATSPSAFFAAARTETVVTDSSGLATSSTPQADNGTGTYNITVSSASVTSVTMTLTNLASSPSPSATPTATISPPPGGARPRLVLNLTSPSTITPGIHSTFSGVGRAGDAVILRCYSRTPQNSQPGSGTPSYFNARSATLSSGGATTFSLNPGTNTRCFLKYADVADSDTTSSITVVQNVATALSLSAYRDGVRQYHFQGTILPHRSGQLITLYRLSGTGQEIRTATTTTDASGVWRINRHFTGSGQFYFRARTGQTLTNVAGVSNTRLTIIH